MNKLRSSVQHAAKTNVYTAVAVAVLGCLVLSGWVFNIEAFKRIFSGLVAMNPMTAVGFLLTAVSLVLVPRGQRAEIATALVWLARASAFFVTSIGVAKVIEIIGGPDVGIDRWLFHSKLSLGFRGVNMMAPNTALNFVLVGNALLLIHSKKRRSSPLACIAALVCGFEAILAILGYAYGVAAFYGLHTYIPMALPTAIGFLLVTIGIMSCQAKSGFLAVVIGENVGGIMARRLLPAAILVPAIIGWLRFAGQRRGFFDSEFGVALYTVTNMLVFGTLIACNAYLLFKVDARRAKADLQTRRVNDKLQEQIQKQAETNRKLESIVSVQQEIGTADVGLNGIMTLMAKRTQGLTGAEGAVIELVKGDEMVYRAASGTTIPYLGTRLKIADSFSGLCVREEKTLSCADADNDIRVNREVCQRIGVRSMIVAPLQARKNTVGALKVLSSRKDAFSHEDVMALQAMAGLMGAALYRKQAEQELLRSKSKLEIAIHDNQLIMDNSRDVICTVDTAGRFVAMSAACETLWGYKPEELMGKPYTDFVYEEDVEKTAAIAAEVMAGNAVSAFENRYKRKDGSVIDVMWSAYWSETDKIMFAVAHDITERARAEKALKQAKEEADCANRAKSEFLSRMSHELRTPMNAILGFAQVLEMENLTEDQRESIGHIVRGGRHLLELINEVLDISLIEAGRLTLSTEPVDLAEAVRETMEMVRLLASDRNVRINCAALHDVCVLADRQRLKQVLINLLSNAIKYNRPNGSVALSCEQNGNLVRIFVKDSGFGIAAERLEELFTPFERLGAENSTIEGTGLGLAVSKRLVEAMGGTIGVESFAGEGTTFWLDFPLTQSPLIATQLSDLAGDAKNVDPARKWSVLYIEDNLSNLRLIERVLSHRPSIELISAPDGTRGLKLAKENAPDLILLDLNLPDMHGKEVLNRLKSDPRCVEIPVVVISADAMNAQKERLVSAGATEYLTKPLNIQKFLTVLDRSLSDGSNGGSSPTGNFARARGDQVASIRSIPLQEV
jgi:PAS domain S-box-containing protein